MDGRKTQTMACTFYLINRETGETIQAGEVPPKALEAMRVHLSQNMSDYYSRHMEQYIPLRPVIAGQRNAERKNPKRLGK